jgi:thiol-disulfide isomerase/thioredoxin
MRYLRYCQFLIALSVCTGCSFGDDKLSGLLGSEAPITRFTALDGTYRTIEEFGGRPLVLMFWAEYCSFSKPEIEELNELAKELKDSSQAVFLAVSLDENEQFEAVNDRVTYRELSALEHAFSGNGTDDEAYLSFKANELPHFYVISSQGKIVAEGHSSSIVKDAFAQGFLSST